METAPEATGNEIRREIILMYQEINENVSILTATISDARPNKPRLYRLNRLVKEQIIKFMGLAITNDKFYTSVETPYNIYVNYVLNRRRTKYDTETTLELWTYLKHNIILHKVIELEG